MEETGEGNKGEREGEGEREIEDERKGEGEKGGGGQTASLAGFWVGGSLG